MGICVTILKGAEKNRGLKKSFRPGELPRGPERLLRGPEIYREPGPPLLYFNHCMTRTCRHISLIDPAARAKISWSTDLPAFRAIRSVLPRK